MMPQTKEKPKSKEPKKKKSSEELSVIAQKAVEARRKNNPGWGEKTRAKKATKKKKEK